MTTNTSRLFKQSTYFFNDIQNNTIKQYYGINDEDINIHVYQTHIDTYLLEFKYSKGVDTNVINFANLPDELSKKINSYLFDYINVIYKIKCNDSFMIPPKCRLFSIQYKIPKPYINIIKYYKYLIIKHNCFYHNDTHWSPANTIRITILEIITMMKLNHFKYLFA
jgi:hypothetical protein